MIIRGIQIENGVPVRITADLTLDELAWVAERAGKTSGDQIGGDLWDTITGELFNRWWSDGYTGYVNGDATS